MIEIRVKKDSGETLTLEIDQDSDIWDWADAIHSILTWVTFPECVIDNILKWRGK